jgi:nucleotide-binding universal stress UspA family protein
LFLVVVDNSEEMMAALHFACMRAKRCDGGVALLYVIEPVEFQHWMAVGNLMQEEAREKAEMTLSTYADYVEQTLHAPPTIFIREGDVASELLKVVNDEPEISILVLGSGVSAEGPGPLVTALTGKMAQDLCVPLTIIPGDLPPQAIEGLA